MKYIKSVKIIFLYIFNIDVKLFQNCLLKTVLYSVVLPFIPCQRSVDCIYVNLFGGSVSGSVNLFIYSFANTTFTVAYARS